MSPVAPSSGHAGRALAVSAVSIVVLGLGLFLAAVVFSRQSSPKVRLGDATFQGGSAERLAAEIADRGPILYPDVSGTEPTRDLILQHLGGNPERGWYAFLARPAGKARSCTWEWQADESLFRARCDHDLTAPADGAGLETFPVTVTDGRLDVDLNAADRTTTTAPDTTTTTTPVSGTRKTTTTQG